MSKMLLERRVFLEKEVIRLNAMEMKPLMDSLGRYPTCAFCRKAKLRPCFGAPKAGDGPYEIAVKLPCSHVFGNTCIDNHFKMVRPGDMLYYDTCPECNVKLFTQGSHAEQFDKASIVSESIEQSRWNIITFSLMYTQIVYAIGMIFTSIRILFVEPHIGARYGQLLQIPVMLYGIWMAANVVVHYLQSSELSKLSKSKEILSKGPISLPLTVSGKNGYLTLGLYSLQQVLVLVGAYYVMMIPLEASAQRTTIWKIAVKWLRDTDLVCGPLFIIMLGYFALLPACISQTCYDRRIWRMRSRG